MGPGRPLGGGTPLSCGDAGSEGADLGTTQGPRSPSVARLGSPLKPVPPKA